MRLAHNPHVQSYYHLHLVVLTYNGITRQFSTHLPLPVDPIQPHHKHTGYFSMCLWWSWGDSHPRPDQLSTRINKLYLYLYSTIIAPKSQEPKQ